MFVINSKCNGAILVCVFIKIIKKQRKDVDERIVNCCISANSKEVTSTKVNKIKVNN